ncbi:hypothetical protein AB0J74_33060 [Asanoa sp. NPDC049573]|uniref:hypothetical protein n=1 Tax=Asanoa sp. NPDC049573 TaxID=3155396 RepID=UPI003427FF3C
MSDASTVIDEWLKAAEINRRSSLAGFHYGTSTDPQGTPHPRRLPPTVRKP